MANFVYNETKHALLQGLLNFDTGGDDIRVLLVMTDTTADTQDDANTFADFTTLDEFNGSGYSSGGLALAGEVVNEDVTNNRAEFDAGDITFPNIGAGTRSIQAAIVYKFNTTLSDSEPLIYVDDGGFPIDPNGGDIAVQWNIEGILQAA
jgi:hypothetical protein